MFIDAGKCILFFVLWLGAISAGGQDAIKLDSLKQALENAKSDTVKIKVLIDLSNQYQKSDYFQALAFARQAKSLSVKKGLEKFTALANLTIGTVGLLQGDYKEASTNYFDALKFYETSGDTSHYMAVCNNLGATLDRLSEYDKALQYYFKAQELLNAQRSAEQKRATLLPTLLNNIANIYQTKGDFKSALEYYEKALTLALAVPKHPVQGMAYNNIGKLYFTDLKQPNKALPYLEKGLAVREEIGNQNEIGRSLVMLGTFYGQQKQLEKSIALAKRALTIGEQVGSLDLQKMAYTCLAESYEAMGQHKESLKAFKSFSKFNDSIQTQSANSEITRLQLQYDFEKLEKERQQEAQRNKIKYFSIIAILSAFLLIAILITLFIRSKARAHELLRKNLAQDVELKSKELTTNVIYLIRKNELINNVAERLLAIEKNVYPGNQKDIHDIILDLQKEADHDTWKEFELRFNQVHSDFYNKLRHLYPGLTPADEKLCALLRLNMSSKEIAAITQQSIKSVEVARARLRKKLNLTNTNSNLVTHLAGI